MVSRETTIWSCWAAGGAIIVLAAGASGAPPKSAKRTAAPPTKVAKVAADGATLFQQQCASCHGVNGEGTKDNYPRPLVGVLSTGQLAKYISKSMPPGPKHASVTDAAKIAPYVHDTFYSSLAQERNRPARIALSRLTVRQFKNSVSDLVGSFRGGVPQDKEHGLRAEYFKAQDFNDKERVIQRVDPEVQFNFGQDGPPGGEFNPHRFSIRWSGSVVAPDTGTYDIVVRTEHGMRLWVNDLDKPILDASVQSGTDTEHRASVYLIGGRTYPLRLEFSKSTQGVDDSEKKKGKPAPKASISLAWKRPKLAEEPIPSRCLIPETAPETFVVNTPFPPDDRSMGYERGNSVSKEWDEATTSAALETADYVVAHLNQLAGTWEDKAKLQAFCRKFVERALRRPIDSETEKLYVTRQFAASPDTNTAVKRVVLLTLMSPRFLYREIGASDKDPYNVASRLSFTLWDSLPDDTLLQAAAAGKLATREQIMQQAERMVNDPRAWYKQREFFLQWLKIDQYPDLAKDSKKFPNFTPTVATDLRTSLDMTLENVVRSDASDFRQLLLTDKFFLNGRLAAIYGVPLPANAPFQPVALDTKVRSGVLTHPYILASFAYVAGSSPIHRGVLLTRNVMGRTLQSPPAAFVPLAASLHPDLTTRQRVALQTKPSACQSCHSTINPLGFALEKFDAIGRVRIAENGKPIDDSGSYETRSGETVKFNGAKDLARFVAGSEDAHEAFVEKLFQYEVKQPIRAYGPKALPALEDNFKKNQYSIRRLTVEIATESALPRSK